MKKLILLQLLFLLITAHICNAQAEKPKIIFKCKIASYNKDCESGLGICFLYEIHYRTVNSYISAEGNKIQLQLQRSNMDENLESELLHSNRFPIEEGIILPMDICLRIGLREETTLKQGYYPIKVSDDYFTIECEID